MQFSVDLVVNWLYGELIRKNTENGHCCKSDYWMSSDYDESLKDYWRLPNVKYIVEVAQNEQFEDVV